MATPDRTDLASAFRDHHAEVVAFFARQHVDRETAADLAAESFFQLVRRVRGGERPGSIKAYLFGIALRVGMAARRRRVRAPVSVDGAQMAEVEAAPAADAVGTAADLIAGLPVLQRQVLHLRFVDGLSYAEIAAHLGVPLGTVRSRLHHAVALLRQRTTTEDHPHAGP